MFDSSIHPDRDVGARIGEVVLTTKFGHDLLLDPLLNKGTSFPMDERERLGIRGLVPPRSPDAKTEAALAKQVKRIMRRYFELSSPIGKYAYMVALQDRNEVLFYRCLIDYLEELAPIIYTPTSASSTSHSRTRTHPPLLLTSAPLPVMTTAWGWPVRRSPPSSAARVACTSLQQTKASCRP